MREASAGGRGRPEQRDRLIAGAVEYASIHGLGALSLRPLAAHLDTSDRMLLYYFGSRDEIIRSICDHLTADLQALLTTTVVSRRLSPAELLERAWAVMSDQRLRPSLVIYLEIDVYAARGTEPFVAAAHAATAAWLEWLTCHLDTPIDERDAAAAALLAIVDGLLLQAAVAPTAPTADAHQWLARLLAGRWESESTGSGPRRPSR